MAMFQIKFYSVLELLSAHVYLVGHGFLTFIWSGLKSISGILTIANLRFTTRPAQRRACERKKFVVQDKNCE